MQFIHKMRMLVVVAVIGFGLLLAYHEIFSLYFPGKDGNIGGDYSYFLPSLLDGYFWFLNNGPFSPPWFTAAFCGGLPALPNPQNMYFSVPQWLTFIVDPLKASCLSILCFAFMGFIGNYLLLRQSFRSQLSTALLAATLFMFNSFFSTRELLGHLTFHSFMLAPLIAWLLLQRGGTVTQSRRLCSIGFAGLLFAYVIYSGGVQLIIPLIIILMAIGLIHGLLYEGDIYFWINLSCAGLLGILMSLAKLAPALVFLGDFERSDYLLPGAASIGGLLKLLFESLFYPHPTEHTVRSVLTNVQWGAPIHGFEYGVTFIPLLMLLVALPSLIKNRPKKGYLRQKVRVWFQLGALMLLLFIPLAVNYYTPEWNALLKELPIIRSSSNLFRWFCGYIPLVILGAALAFDRTAYIKKIRPYLASLGIVLVVYLNASIERDYKAIHRYNPTHIINAYQTSHATGQPVTISTITVIRDKNRRVTTPIGRNDTLVVGGSQLFCYEAMFGYRLENFPIKQLRPGSVTNVISDRFNLKDPACYVYAESNDCSPGDHFTSDRINDVSGLTSYMPYHFNMPVWQRVTNGLSLVTLIMVTTYMLLYCLKWLRGIFRD